ncbi:MAG: hypothetical protein EPO26_11515 [Chloroflexota bacterium]|nr:MAG: hypothetical protein EPO26_11515 [Chloroflexota bacterium]
MSLAWRFVCALLTGLAGVALASSVAAEELLVGVDRPLAAMVDAGSEVARGPRGTAVLRISDDDSGSARVAWASRPGVRWIASNPEMRRQAVQDPGSEPLRHRQWHLDHIRVDDAWSFTMGDPDVIVAVVDSGLDLDHPDRPEHLIIGPSFAGVPFGDRAGHGTHVAGLIAAPPNRVGVVGVAPNVTVLVLKTDDADGVIRVFDVYRAILYAVDHGAAIVNLSLGLAADNPALGEAISYARERNVLVVAAGGNNHASGDAPIFPAAYPGVLAVGAATGDMVRAAYSRVGDDIALLAPGGANDGGERSGLTGPLPGARFGSIAGTSAAAPIAAGVAALALSTDRRQSAEAVRDRLIRSARDIGEPGRDRDTGAGLLDAGLAVRDAARSFPMRAAIRDLSCPSPAYAGTIARAEARIVNIGGNTWAATPGAAIRLSAIGDSAPFQVFGEWRGGTIVGDVATVPVLPGSSAFPRFLVRFPDSPGDYVARFGLVGPSGRVPGGEFSCTLRVLPVPHWVADDPRVEGPTRARAGTIGWHVIRFRNAGIETWRRDGARPLRLAPVAPRGRASVLFHPAWWHGPSRVTVPREEVISPGETATFDVLVRYPLVPELVDEAFGLVMEQVTWFDVIARLQVDVRP